jgi:kynurenine--oxoglutarate transaminase/cysteine-S-conjugate beta-lyase/glutamine--phenylpyruvate transaminase
VSEAAAAAVLQQNNLDFMVNQYARSAGHLSLVNTLATKYSALYKRKINPLTEILVADGASEALATAMLGLLNEGDEVVVIEPAFDIYIAQAEMCGAVLKPVPLRVVKNNNDNRAHWALDFKELEAAFTSKTRLLIINTPQNPTGKMFSRSELAQIAEIVAKWPQVVVISDEVYEHMTYDEPHVSIATLSEEIWQRTLTISSAGKTFSITGWKIGWLIGPEHLVRCAAIAHQWLPFSVATPLQEAVASALQTAEKKYENHNNYYDWLAKFYSSKREFLCKALEAAGITPIIPEGGFFIVGDTSRIILPEPYASDSSVTRDWSLCRWLTKEIGVAAIPPSSFYGEKNKLQAANYARFAFCKPDEVLEEAARRLLKCREFLKKE